MIIQKIVNKLSKWWNEPILDLKLREDRLREKTLKFELESRNLRPGVVILTRQLLKGFDPVNIDTLAYENDPEHFPDILEEQGDESAQMAFLGQVKDLKSNTALPKLMVYIIRNQLIYSAKLARVLEEINFGRATINGVSLIKEEIDRLSKIYEEKKKPQEKFDKHEVI